MLGGVPAGRLKELDSGGQAAAGRALEQETANDGSESAGPFAPEEGPARVQVGPGAAPERLDDSDRASKPGNVGSISRGQTGPR